jgi:hypothetical protein
VLYFSFVLISFKLYVMLFIFPPSLLYIEKKDPIVVVSSVPRQIGANEQMHGLNYETNEFIGTKVRKQSRKSGDQPTTLVEVKFYF